MMKKLKNDISLNASIGPNDGHKRSKKEKSLIAAAAKAHHMQRDQAQLLRNKMLAIRYQMEDYLLNDTINIENMKTIQDYANEFLDVLDIGKGAFASHIEIDLSNLNKYYKEDRKFNAELAMKFGHFFHTPADLWLKIQFKNEMLLFQLESRAQKKYKKFDYEKVLRIV